MGMWNIESGEEPAAAGVLTASLFSLVCVGCLICCLMIPALVLGLYLVGVFALLNAVFYLGVAVLGLLGTYKRDWKMMAAFVALCVASIIFSVIVEIIAQVDRDCGIAEDQDQDCDTYYTTSLVGTIIGVVCCLIYIAAGAWELKKFKEGDE
jgi:uncharacterized membrane protein